VAILLEDIEGKVQATIEAVTGLRTSLESKIEALRVDLTRRIENLEFAVRQNSDDIREMKEEIRRMREVLERKADHEALVKLEARVRIVEQRLGIQV
jgi:predicted  nucleic acid-binding Zn-ribbon protein